MVKLKDSHYIARDGSINISHWLDNLQATRQLANWNTIKNACQLAQIAAADKPALGGISCLQEGLAMAEMLLDLKLDAETIAAAIVYSSVHYADLSLEDIQQHLGSGIAHLVQGVIRMDALSNLQGQANYSHNQIENIRKMLLAMVADVRVVLIKLAERTYQIRHADLLDDTRRVQLARETLDIFAPLANRLGLGQIKWELEDLSFRYLNRDIYKALAKQLDQKRLEREQYINQVIAELKQRLQAVGIANAEVYGRAKHIYSIFRKMQRKHIDFNQIYDISAVRVLVNNIEDCYSVLSIVQTAWEQISQEFDDYIAQPKPNGYRSIHTAVIGPNGRTIEVQIRTFAMHQECELGVAAHWRYKEGGQQQSSYETKIAWLRQVLEWQKELSHQTNQQRTIQQAALDDRIYVFTPSGDIIDLAKGSTPLDFAYYIHSDVGHRCRGAKVNGAIVPLNYCLQTGERVEILTAKEPSPSRDWLSPHLGYIKSSRARAKVHHWFKMQDFDHNLAEGKNLLEKELKRLNVHSIQLDLIAQQLKFAKADEMLAALGRSDLKLSSIISALPQQQPTLKAEAMPILKAPRSHPQQGRAEIYIHGVGDLLTHTAKCCKPVPGDEVMGFITHGHGVAIHRADCQNILQANKTNPERLITVSWGAEPQQIYAVDIAIVAFDRPGLIRDVTTLLSSEKINLIAFHTRVDKKEHVAHMDLTIEINGVNSLSRILDKIAHLPNVNSVRRVSR